MFKNFMQLHGVHDTTKTPNGPIWSSVNFLKIINCFIENNLFSLDIRFVLCINHQK